jgi:Ca2+-binding RTX toxin-like protein
LDGDDEIWGDEQEGRIIGRGGNDSLYGGSENDAYVVCSGFGQNYIDDRDGRNVIHFTDKTEGKLHFSD